jgi:hypothetical protein
MKSIAIFALMTSVLLQPPAGESEFKNLTVLPPDTTVAELNEVMLENLRGLGLRRLAGEGCLACHVGDLETPRSEWDYASDAKPMKDKARVMMRMVVAINEEHLPQLATRIASPVEVSCTTCHRGRQDPRALPDLLLAVYEEDGVEAASTRYRELRDRYFGSEAYDFRVHTLPALARHLAGLGKMEDGIAFAALNVEAHPDDPSAKRSWLGLTMRQIIDAKGVEAALAELDRMAPTLTEGVVTPRLLDNLAWPLIRSEREAEGHALVEANFDRFPEQYVPNESMAFILADSDRMDEAIALLEKWLEGHPDHARARRLLVNLREE